MLRQFYLPWRFFYAFTGIIAVFIFSFVYPWLFIVAQGLLVVGAFLVVCDAVLLFWPSMRVSGHRQMAKVLSLGDDNRVQLTLSNLGFLDLYVTVVEELPPVLQERDFEFKAVLQKQKPLERVYLLRPVERGSYVFGETQVFARSVLGLVERRFSLPTTLTVPVFPSVIQMKQYELRAFKDIAHASGIKKIRRLGHSYEFEQVKSYVAGDDVRTINWKASSRRAALMVNQYEDERAQQVYTIIDKSRVMRLPFNGLTLMDYAINTSLVLSNIVLHKKDKAGLLSFSDKLGAALQADNSPSQLNRILNELYREKEGRGEASYELLYYAVRKLIKGRSLLILYTNFESMYALERVLPKLRLINRFHLLVVVFFVNTEIEEFARTEAVQVSDIFNQTLARKFLNDKLQMQQKLQQYGIQSILTRPEDLSINTINKYLELKARGLI